MKSALLFPGQGTEFARCLADWVEASGEVRRRLEFACGLLGTDVESLLARGGAALRATATGQPARTALTLGIRAEALQAGLRADCVAGHSLGEVAAWAASGALEDTQAVELSVCRGRVMGEAAARVAGGMLALVGAESGTVDDAIRVGSAHGIVELAAHNAPDEWVLTGELPALDAIALRWPSRRLEVDGPWHSRLMAGAEQEFRAACSRVEAVAPATEFHVNRTGAVARDPETMADLVAGQLTRPLRWVDTIEAMDAERFLIAGPGRVLRGTVRKTLGATADIRVLETPADLGALKEYQS